MKITDRFFQVDTEWSMCQVLLGVVFTPILWTLYFCTPFFYRASLASLYFLLSLLRNLTKNRGYYWRFLFNTPIADEFAV